MRPIDELDDQFEDDSSAGVDSHSDASTYDDEENKEQSLNTKIGGSETKKVKKVRHLMILVLVFVTAFASIGVYFYSRSTQQREFANEFDGQGFKIISGFQDDTVRKLQALDSLATRLTAYGIDTNATWPFVTVANSAKLFEPYLRLANAAAILMFPLVYPRQRAQWEEYAIENQGWIEENLAGRGSTIEDDVERITPYIKNYVGIDTSPGRWMVWWQYAPVISNRYFVNFNQLAIDGFRRDLQAVEEGRAVLSRVWSFEKGLDFQSLADFNFMDELLVVGGNGNYEEGEPVGYIHYPVFDTFESSRTTVAMLTGTVYWKSYLENILPNTVKGIDCVFENNLGEIFTYRVSGNRAQFLGFADLHQTKYSDMVIRSNYSSFQDSTTFRYEGLPLDEQYTSYSIRVYPTSEFEDEYVDSTPFLYATVMFAVFLFTVIVFVLYDYLVEQRQEVVLSTAVKSNAVVSNLFPENVRDRLLEEAGEKQRKKELKSKGLIVDDDNGSTSSRPIADFFPETTILFADIAGFTAWSSVREPAQVFVLLESLYASFDSLAKHKGVFKVETIGDCYVAVVGLPLPRPDHPVVMAKFARSMLFRFGNIVARLEVELGPGTGDLDMRVGMHSGPVTGGVLRGDKSRFQLFGDTMNTASRMESTGVRGKIQVSEDTANLLIAAGKGHWLQMRQKKVVAKGKGEMQTYWIVAGGTTVGSGSIGNASESSLSEGNIVPTDSNTYRLIRWNMEVLRKLLKNIVAHRDTISEAARPVGDISFNTKPGGTVLDEIQEVIILPKFDLNLELQQRDPATIELSGTVEEQLESFVTRIAYMYRENSFHCFEHASHAAMSVNKLLSRIVAPSEADLTKQASAKHSVHLTLHDHSYGITSDPLTQFACVFAVLIHDVDHQGVSNGQLIAEKAPVAVAYKNRSVAEQNSLDLAWDLLMQEDYADLRATIYADAEELKRFRQLVVNMVIATDVFDKDLIRFRNERWDRAFGEAPDDDENRCRKASVVIEHLIQASDVAHTMQHWHVYRKWNEKLFVEIHRAFKDGRASRDPATFWFEGELGFFDGYIIPLARKLKDCGVFGVSSDEYLTYAERNRQEWETKGRQIVEEMVHSLFNESHAASEQSVSEGEFDVPISVVRAPMNKGVSKLESFDD